MTSFKSKYAALDPRVLFQQAMQGALAGAIAGSRRSLDDGTLQGVAQGAAIGALGGVLGGQIQSGANPSRPGNAGSLVGGGLAGYLASRGPRGESRPQLHVRIDKGQQEKSASELRDQVKAKNNTKRKRIAAAAAAAAGTVAAAAGGLHVLGGKATLHNMPHHSQMSRGASMVADYVGNRNVGGRNVGGRNVGGRKYRDIVNHGGDFFKSKGVRRSRLAAARIVSAFRKSKQNTSAINFTFGKEGSETHTAELGTKQAGLARRDRVVAALEREGAKDGLLGAATRASAKVDRRMRGLVASGKLKPREVAKWLRAGRLGYKHRQTDMFKGAGHAAELAGLGILAAPTIAEMRGRKVSTKTKHRAELAGLGILAAPSAIGVAKDLVAGARANRAIAAMRRMSPTKLLAKHAFVGIGVEVAHKGRWGASVGFPYGVAGNYRLGDGEWAPTVGLGLTGPYVGISYREKKKSTKTKGVKTRSDLARRATISAISKHAGYAELIERYRADYNHYLQFADRAADTAVSRVKRLETARPQQLE